MPVFESYQCSTPQIGDNCCVNPKEDGPLGESPLLFFIWNILLLPWTVVACAMAMAFDSPATLSTYVGVWSIWSYPISVGIVWLFRKKHPLIVLFPCINFAVFLVSCYVS